MSEPQCPYFGSCGGCTLQHVEHETQLGQKKQKMVRASGLSDVQVFALNPYHYRNMMDFVFHYGGLGLRKKGDWHSVVDIQECPISQPEINTLLAEIRT